VDVSRRRIRVSALALALVLLCGALLILGAGGVAARGSSARAAAGRLCGDSYPAARSASNPLMLSPAAPAANPLGGARLFVDGPKHGVAAGAIAHLLGIDTGTPLGSALPSFADGESWTTFSRFVASRLSHVSPGVRRKVLLLEKIASQPEAQRISTYSHGGTPAGIFAQMQKLLCVNLTADPGSIPVISTYFLHAKLRGCPTNGEMNAYRPLFEAQIDAIARATGNRPVVYLVELDAIGSSSCIARHGGIRDWESLLRYEATRLGGLPHTVVYIEGGYSDSNSAAYAARVLNASGVRHVEGFFTNDTHINWTINEIRYGERVSRMTHGAHFIVNTDQNGRGPKLNRHPSRQGIEDLCNPPGRGLGPRDTTSTGFANADAFMWTHPPGNSSGCGGGPAGGIFWPARAIGLAARANGRLGPGYPGRPY
jgi:endoglucanase